jgi:uncharacterized protein (DUF1778 family)
MKMKTKRRAPISLRVSGSDAALLSEAAALACVPRHRLIREAAMGMARTLLATAPSAHGASFSGTVR